MIKFQDLDLTDIKLHTASSELGFDKVAFGDEVIWEKSVSPLPSGYRQVEYLEATGNGAGGQYIDTHLIPNSQQVITFDYMFADFITAMDSIQVGCGGTDRLIISAPKIQSKFIVAIGDNRTTNFAKDTQNHKVIFDIPNGLIHIDDYQISAQNVPSAFNYSFALHARHNRDGFNFRGHTKNSFFNVTENGVVVMNLVSCLDPNDRPCMFDLVSQQPFYNQGAGEFGYKTMDGTIVAPT